MKLLPPSVATYFRETIVGKDAFFFHAGVILKDFLAGAGYGNKVWTFFLPLILNSQFSYKGGVWTISVLYASFYPLRYYFKTKEIKKPYIFFNTVLNSLNLSLLLSSITETEIFPQTMLARFLFLGLTFSALLPLTYSQTIKQFRPSVMLVAVHNQTQSALSTVKNAVKKQTDNILQLALVAGAASTVKSTVMSLVDITTPSLMHILPAACFFVQIALLLMKKKNQKYDRLDTIFLYFLVAAKHMALQNILTTNIVGNFVYGRPGEPNFAPYTYTAFYCVLMLNAICGLLFAAHDIHVMKEDQKRRQAASQSVIIELEEIKPDTTPDSPQKSQEGKKRLSDELSEQGTLSRSRTPSPVKESPLQSPLLAKEQWTEISIPPSSPQLAIVAPVEPLPSVLSPQSPGFFARARAWVLGAPAQTPKDVELAVRANNSDQLSR